MAAGVALIALTPAAGIKVKEPLQVLGRSKWS